METSPEYLFDIPTPKNIYSSSNEYAVIISGGADSSLNHERYWNHCAALYKTLVNIYHYDKSRIFVVFADGTNNGIDRHRLNNSYDSSPLDFDNDGIADIQYAATRSNISLVFNTLQQNVTSEDNVFVFVTDHGGRRDSIATITLWHESGLSTSEFASEINKINHAKTINLCLVQCCSGGFISALSGPNRVITTSCKLTESAHSSYPYHYSNFCYHWLSAISGLTPEGNVVNADGNNDGFVSMYEAYVYARDRAIRNDEHAQYSSPIDPNLGAYLTLGGVLEYDLYTKDNEYDIGDEPEPHLMVGHANSPDIWVRRWQDGGESHQSARQGRTNYVYAQVHNKGITSSSENDTIQIFVKRASLGTTGWPNGWTKIGEKQIEPIQTNNTELICIPSDFPTIGNIPYGLYCQDVSFALLSRIVSSKDNISFTESSNAIENVRNNNNISYKNVVVSNAIWIGDMVVDMAIAAIDNLGDEPYFTNLICSSPQNESGKPLYEEAEIRMCFDAQLIHLWEENEGTTDNMKRVDDTTFLITGPDAQLNDFVIPANYEGYMVMQINFLTQEYTEKDKYEYVIDEYDPATGELQGSLTVMVDKTMRSYLFDAETGDDLVVTKNSTVTVSAENIGENAIYNWYNAADSLIGSGENLSITASSTSKYKLEVIATADGYKDYDSIFVVTTLGKITGISPNPANGQVTISYDLSSDVTSATIVIANATGQVLYSAPLDVTQTTHTVNLQAIPTGQYTVRIEFQGSPLDSQTLIVY